MFSLRSSNDCIKMEVNSCNSSAQKLPVTPHHTLSKSQTLYSGLQGPTYSAYTLPWLFHSIRTGIPASPHTCQAHCCSKAFRMRFSCLKCPYPRYLDDLLPHFPQVFTQMSPSQWGLSSGNMLLLSTTHSPRHSLSTLLHYFPPWHVLLAYLSQLFTLFIVLLSLLEFQLHEGNNFCLFCLMLQRQTWKSTWWTIGTQSILYMNEWVSNTVSGEETSRLDNKVERRYILLYIVLYLLKFESYKYITY